MGRMHFRGSRAPGSSPNYVALYQSLFSGPQFPLKENLGQIISNVLSKSNFLIP